MVLYLIMIQFKEMQRSEKSLVYSWERWIIKQIFKVNIKKTQLMVTGLKEKLYIVDNSKLTHVLHEKKNRNTEWQTQKLCVLIMSRGDRPTVTSHFTLRRNCYVLAKLFCFVRISHCQNC